MPSVDLEENRIEVGDFFEGCSFHPLLCFAVDYEMDSLDGISIVDGSVQSCSIFHCGVRKLTPREAMTWRFRGPQDIGEGYSDPQTEWGPELQWWKHEGKDNFSWWDPLTNDFKKSE